MAKQKTCTLKVRGKSGKTLHGTAAQLSYISQRGGFDKFINDFATNVAKKAVSEYINEMSGINKQQFQSVS